MNDPHVRSLRYSLHAPDRISYEGAAPLRTENDGFNLLLEDGILVAEPRHHYASEEDARKVLEEVIASWEIDVALSQGEREIAFDFESSEVIDRNPPPPGSPLIVHAKSAILVSSAAQATLSIARGEYPPPPKYFRMSPDAATLWFRFEGYLDGHEPLASAAFFCVTVLQGIFGSRIQAARKCNISRNVISTLARLATEKGDAASARKYPSKGLHIAHSAAEIAWMEAAFKAIIRRVGEINRAESLPKISMDTLPSLE
jgi:hypothetical protein